MTENKPPSKVQKASSPKVTELPAAYATGPAPGLPPWFLKSIAWTGALGVLTANLSVLLPHIAALRTALQESFGLIAFESFSTFAGALMVLGLGAGYFCGCALFYFLWLRKQPRFKLPFLIGAAALAPFVLFFSLSLRPASDLGPMQSERLAELLAMVDQNYVSAGANYGGYWFATDNASMGPQGWTTAQVLSGVLQSPSSAEGRAQTVERVRRSLAYIESIRQPNGWGYQDGARITVTEIIGWVATAEALALHPDPHQPVWTAAEEGPARDRLFKDLAELAGRQHADGGWGPLSPTAEREHQRTYSTVVSMMAFLAARDADLVRGDARWTYDNDLRRGARWLMLNATEGQEGAKGWWPNPYVRRTDGDCLGLTSQVMYVLAHVDRSVGLRPYDAAFAELRTGYLARLREGDGQFASIQKRPLDMNCQLQDSESYLFGQPDFTLERSTFLWYPWTMAAVSELSRSTKLSADERRRLDVLDDILTRRLPEMTQKDLENTVLYPTAETLFGLGVRMRNDAVLNP